MTPTLARAIATAEAAVKQLQAERVPTGEIVSAFGIVAQRLVAASIAAAHPEKVEVARSIVQLIGAIGRATAKRDG